MFHAWHQSNSPARIHDGLVVLNIYAVEYLKGLICVHFKHTTGCAVLCAALTVWISDNEEGHPVFLINVEKAVAMNGQDALASSSFE